VIGYSADTKSTGNENTFVGTYAGQSVAGASGSENVGIGYLAWDGGVGTVNVGFASGESSTGSFNTALGDSAAYRVSGVENTYLGAFAGAGAQGETAALYRHHLWRQHGIF
jgi:hypothetical protein